jgi:hypothetical protein
MTKRPEKIEREFIEDVAKAKLAGRPPPPYPSVKDRLAIQKAGGVEKWIKQDGKRHHQFEKFIEKAEARANKEKKPAPLKIFEGPWPRELQYPIKGYRRPPSGGNSIKPSPLSAGTPGNEETDPGPFRDY